MLLLRGGKRDGTAPALCDAEDGWLWVGPPEYTLDVVAALCGTLAGWKELICSVGRRPLVLRGDEATFQGESVAGRPGLGVVAVDVDGEWVWICRAGGPEGLLRAMGAAGASACCNDLNGGPEA